MTTIALLGLASSPPNQPFQAQIIGEISDPVWRERPSQQMMDATYPMEAMKREKVGTVTVQCLASATGAFAGCRIICETPAGFGFGRSAMSVASAYKLVPILKDGRSVANMTVKIPIFFAPEPSMNPPRCDQSAGEAGVQ